ncbi:MAG: cytochrome c maturation protein CcmE [Bryobacteraceae bacterium]
MRVLGFAFLGFGAFVVIAFLFMAAPIPDMPTYYKTISEVRAMGENAIDKPLIVAGDVEVGSIVRNGKTIRFVLREHSLQMQIVYAGAEPLPDTFRGGALAIISGKLGRDASFRASKISSIAPPNTGRARTSEEPENLADATISLGEIVRTMNEAATASYGKKFIVRYEGGLFATVEVNPELWEGLTPLQQKAVGTRLAQAFGRTGQINCRVKVYGIEVGHVRPSLWGGYQYEPR